MNTIIISFHSESMVSLTINFYCNNMKAIASTSCTSPYPQKKDKSIPNTEKVMIMLVNNCESQPHLKPRDKGQPSLRHVLFPSRCPPQLFLERDVNASTASKTLEDEATLMFGTNGKDSPAWSNNSLTTRPHAMTTSATPASSLPKPFRYHTFHRRSRYVFVSNHSPKKSSSPCPSPKKSRSSTKSAHVRKHHRRHNLALNEIDFDILLRGFMHREDLGSLQTNESVA